MASVRDQVLVYGMIFEDSILDHTKMDRTMDTGFTYTRMVVIWVIGNTAKSMGMEWQAIRMDHVLIEFGKMVSGVATACTTIPMESQGSVIINAVSSMEQVYTLSNQNRLNSLSFGNKAMLSHK
eukprot:CAMPEP_0116878576 /NCGR_PEP_ID=MMETSP0463-20121206/10318_1 /TAXON_ID=181622 /ORGANISM="Strombidinopsis sp, Strain SopsisLIS2011" /LENGTH=123 /DNA_ID=CAMNT_0004526919 /DNA_START=668 /DNA_END=1039 /DNA_ORIENTATION=-